MTLKEHALQYAEQGFNVFPLLPGKKEPAISRGCKAATKDLDQISKWWDKNPKYNIGIATGSGLVVIDLDNKEDKNGLESLAQWCLENKPLPITMTARTGGGGEHRYYKLPAEFKQKNKINLFPGIDIRGDGGYVVAPPSSHENGNKYEWSILQSITTADAVVLAFLEGKNISSAFTLPEEIGEGCRNDTLFRYAASMQAKGISDEEIEIFVNEANQNRCNPPLGESDILEIVESVLGRYQKGLNLNKFHILNARGMAVKPYDFKIVEEILSQYDFFTIGNYLYLYEDGVYSEDEYGNLSMEIIQRYIYPQFITSNAVTRIYKLLLLNVKRRIRQEDINKYPDTWINFKDGMYDVLTGEMHSHDPKYLSVNQIPHKLPCGKPMGEHIISFMEEAIPNLEDRDMLYTFAGYCMTKDTKFNKFMFITGRGGTGKSLLIDLILYMVGEVNSTSISLQNLAERFYAFQLMNKTLNACSEIPGTALNTVDQIKSLTSGDRMKAERKGKDSIMFRNYAKLLFSANRLPVNLDESSNALFRRMLILKMNEIPKRPIAGYVSVLKKEINYFIMECINHLQTAYILDDGIIESRSSREEVNQLYRDSDSVKDFLDECCDLMDPHAKETRKHLFDCYQMYCYSQDRKPYSNRNFYNNLKNQKGLEEVKSNGERYFKGIRVCRVNVEGQI